MQGSKGIAIGFVAGLAVAGGAVLLLREVSPPQGESDARVAELSAKIDRLERSLSQASSQPRAQSAAVAAGRTTSAADDTPAVVAEDPAVVAEQRRVIASADAKVEEAIQTGQWSLEQSRELDRLTIDLPPEERQRIHTRITAAINHDQVKVRIP